MEDREDSEVTNEQIRQKDTATQINNLINLLEKREAILLIRLSYKIVPSNLLDIYYISNEKEKEEIIKKMKLSEKKNISSLQNYSLQEKKISTLTFVGNYLAMFSQNYKFSELIKLLNKSENSARRLKKDSFKKLQDLAKEKNLNFY